MVPLGGEKCHGQNELEPFPFPGGTQQFKVPAPSRSKVQWGRGFLLKTRLTYYLSLDSSVVRALGDKYDEKMCVSSNPIHATIFFQSFFFFFIHFARIKRGQRFESRLR